MKFHSAPTYSNAAKRIAVCVVFCGLSSVQAQASGKNNEEYFMSRARYAANIVCTKSKAQSGYDACFERQMRAAKRIVARNKKVNSERFLKKTMECLQTVSVLPVKLRRKGLLWVETCIR